jgi:hypothetical protein
MYNITVTTLAANATAEKIFTYKPARKTVEVRIINRGSQVLDYGYDDTIVTGSALPLAIDAEVTLTGTIQDVWAIGATAASSNIVIVEKYLGEDV